MKLFKSKKSKVVAICTAAGVALAVAGSAAAYIALTASGSTSGTSAPIAASSTQAVTITASAVGAPVYAGSVPIPFSVANPNPSSPVDLVSVTGTITSTSVPACLPAWFTITPGDLGNGSNAGTTGPWSIPASGQYTDAGPGSTMWSLNFPANATVDQSSCAGATVTFSLSTP